MKTCTKCKISKPKSEFYKNKTKPDGLTYYCKECKKSYNRKHYLSNAEKWSESRARSRDANRRKIKDYINTLKGQTPCADCKRRYNPWQMDFDHLRDKAFTIAGSGKSLELIKAEIAKCEIVCANCHRNRTYERLGTGLAGKEVSS